MEEYRSVLEKMKNGKIQGVVFAVEHGDVHHHEEINNFMILAKKHKAPVQLIEESLNEERFAKDQIKAKIKMVKELGKIARKHGIINKEVYTLSTRAALESEQKALELAVNELNAGRKQKAEVLYNIARGIGFFKNPLTRERYLVYDRVTKWNALPADSGAIKEMMRIAMIEKSKKMDNTWERVLKSLWNTRNLTMFKNMKKVRAAGKIPVLITGKLHADDIRKLAEKEGWKIAIIPLKTRASAGEKWLDRKQYKKSVLGKQ